MINYNNNIYIYNYMYNYLYKIYIIISNINKIILNII